MPSRPDRRRAVGAALVVLAALLVGLVAPSPATAVVDGRPADPGEWPWQVALLLFGDQFCGGTLVTPRHVLTAAHCVDQFEPAEIEVLAGTVDLRQGGERRSVAVIHRHEQWDDYNLRFDIALLELAEPFVLSDTIGLASIATDAQVQALGAVGSPLVVTGFGATGEFEEGSPVLLEGDVEAVDDTRCLDVYRELGIATYGETQVCAVGPQGIDACYGDSGGPLVAAVDPERTRWVQLGVVSWGAGCGAPGHPTVYTEVWAFIDWLAERGVTLATGQEFEGGGTRIPARGTVGKASQYPLGLDVAGFEGPLTSIAVRLVGLRHSRASDLDIWLVAPDGTAVTLLSDAGGDQRFEDTALLLLQTAAPGQPGGPVGVAVGPTDHEPDPQWRADAPPADLGVLAGIDPNGRWELLVGDDQQGASGELASWTLVLG